MRVLALLGGMQQMLAWGTGRVDVGAVLGALVLKVLQRDNCGDAGEGCGLGWDA